MTVRRRHLLAGVAVALAGCTTADDRAGDARERTREFVESVAALAGHQLEGEVTVGVDDRSDADHDLEAIAREALAFWEGEGAEYVDFEFAFRLLDADADETEDLRIRYVNDRSDLERCTDYHTEDILGCAPIVEAGKRVERPITAEVVATDRPAGEVVLTTQHEIGHTLGLDHDDEPAWVMSNDVRDRLPEYDARVDVREQIEGAWETRNDGTRAFNDGIERWNEEAYDAAVEPFETSENTYGNVPSYVDAARSLAEAFEDMERPETVDREALADQFDRTVETADLAAEAAASMADAAASAADRNTLQARRHRRDANDALEEMDAIGTPTPADVAVALGLVREGDDPDAEDPEPGG